MCKSTTPDQIDITTLRNNFDKPLVQVASSLEISVTTLKKICRSVSKILKLFT